MSALTKVTEHVYWMPPGAPDRPSLCGVVGDRRTLMLDAGSSKAHAREFLDALSTEAVARPSAVVYTHSDWDHVFGGAELGAPVIAHVLTAEQLVELAEMDDIVFQDGIDIDLGGVTVRVRHVGGNHSADSSVMYIEPDRVLFLGDCMYDSPTGVLTAEVAFPLHDAILGFDAELYVDGHHAAVLSHPDIEVLIEKMRLAEIAVREGSAIAISDEDTQYFVQAFRGGRATAS